jgi:hypothetical protein
MSRYRIISEIQVLKSTVQELYLKPGTVLQTCNPSYLGGRDQEDHSFRLARQKGLLARPHLNQCLGMVTQVIILPTQEAQRLQSRPAWAKSETLSQKLTNVKRAGRVAQVIKQLPSKHEALSSIPNTDKKKFV